jgi:hypothetical protein
MIQQDWYAPESWEGETFLALSRGEATTERLAMLALSLGPESRRIVTDEFTVLTYGWNIATNLACDQTSVSHMGAEGKAPQGDIVSAKYRVKTPTNPDDVISVLIRNSGKEPLAGQGDAPVAARFEWVLEDQEERQFVSRMVKLPCAIQPGETRAIQFKLPESPEGKGTMRISLARQFLDTARNMNGEVVEVPYEFGLSRTVFEGDFDQNGQQERNPL